MIVRKSKRKATPGGVGDPVGTGVRSLGRSPGPNPMAQRARDPRARQLGQTVSKTKNTRCKGGGTSTWRFCPTCGQRFSPSHPNPYTHQNPPAGPVYDGSGLKARPPPRARSTNAERRVNPTTRSRPSRQQHDEVGRNPPALPIVTHPNAHPRSSQQPLLQHQPQAPLKTYAEAARRVPHTPPTQRNSRGALGSPRKHTVIRRVCACVGVCVCVDTAWHGVRGHSPNPPGLHATLSNADKRTADSPNNQQVCLKE